MINIQIQYTIYLPNLSGKGLRIQKVFHGVNEKQGMRIYSTLFITACLNYLLMVTDRYIWHAPSSTYTRHVLAV